MTPFWRKDPLAEDEQSLLTLLDKAHHESATRGNISHEAVRFASFGSGDYTKAIIAALSTIGGVHAPLIQTYHLLLSFSPASAVRNAEGTCAKVPGWGNSFIKDGPDPLWVGVHDAICRMNPDLADKIKSVTDTFRFYGKRLYPNPSCYTAACAIILGMPAHLSPYLFVRGRLNAWSAVYNATA